MKQDRDEALRWFRQAEHNLRVAENNFKSDFFSDTCYMCEQASQIALKSYLIFKSARPVRLLHSIQKLAEECMKYSARFKDLIENGKILDRYYVPTRYPDALAPPSVPYETYNRNDAESALKIAGSILQTVREEIGI